MKTWIYQQSTGILFDPEGKKCCRGYSGRGEGKNNPKMDHVKSVGPIPKGDWVIGLPYNSQRIGRYALPLYQHGHNSKGRNYFRIHGDSISNPGEASKGCMIHPLTIRKLIHQSNCKLLKVIE